MRPVAIVVLIVAVIGIVFGRVTRTNPIAIAGYALLAVAIVLGFLSRR